MTDYMKAQGLSVSLSRVQNYLSYLEEAFLVFRCRRYDLKGMRHLALYDKFYMTDIGIRHGLVGYRDNDIAGLLENVVYLELRARGYTVSVGKFRDYEIDFVAERRTERLYVQVWLLAFERGHGRPGVPVTQADARQPSQAGPVARYRRSQPTAAAFDGRISSISSSTRSRRGERFPGFCGQARAVQADVPGGGSPRSGADLVPIRHRGRMRR